MALHERTARAGVAEPAWAWAPYRPAPDMPWTLARAAHLYRRAGFGANWPTLERALSEGPEVTINRLLERPKAVGEHDQAFDQLESRAGSADEVRGWWLRRMIESPWPLAEKMTLFWHGLLAIGLAGGPALFCRHIGAFRAEALGNFAKLYRGAASDPAVLVALGAEENRKARPIELLARGLVESLGVGTGIATPRDIGEAARALTGWFVIRGQRRFLEHEHDRGIKEVLGQRGDWGIDDIQRITLDSPHTPRRLVRRLYAWLISEVDHPDDALLDPVVRRLSRDYEIRPIVEMMLRSNLFFSAAAYRQRVKSPLDFALGAIVALEGRVATLQLGRDLAGLGHDLIAPPTADGWAGGMQWINPPAMVARANLAWKLLSPSGPYKDGFDVPALIGRYGQQAVHRLKSVLVDGDPRIALATVERSGAGGASRAAYELLATAEYQLA